MKQTLFVIFLQCMLALPGYAQKNTKELIASEFLIIQPEKVAPAPMRLHIRHIEVKDFRYDTTKFGYAMRHQYKKLATAQSLSLTMQDFLQQQYAAALDPGAKNALVIVLKNLWIQQTSVAELRNQKIERESENTELFLACTATCEVYLAQDDLYIPLFRLDSMYTANNASKNNLEFLLTKPFEDCIRKLSGLDLSKADAAKKKLSRIEFERFNNQRFQYPRLSDDIVDRGIYKTFRAFLYNRVTKAEFTIQFGAHSDEVFVTENGKPVAITDFWAVSNGEQNFLKIGYSLFAMARQNNSYDIWGSKLSIHKYQRYSAGQTNNIRDAMIGSPLMNKNRVVTYGKPLQLNMETGMVY